MVSIVSEVLTAAYRPEVDVLRLRPGDRDDGLVERERDDRCEDHVKGVRLQDSIITFQSDSVTRPSNWLAVA